MNSIIENSAILEGVELSHDFVLNGRKTTRWFNISASPVYLNERIYALLSFIDITDRVLKEKELKALGMTDPLTGLHNRRSFMDLLIEALDAMASDQSICISMIDIDNLKKINL